MSWWDDNRPTIAGQPPSPWSAYGGGANEQDQPPPDAPASPMPPFTPPAAGPGFGGIAWQQTPAGQQLFNTMKSYFPTMTDAEIAQHLNFSQMPSPKFFNDIVVNLQRANATPPAATSTTSGSQKYAGMAPQQAFQAAAKNLGMTPQSARGHLSQIATELNNNGLPGWAAKDDTADDWISYNGKGFDAITSGGEWTWLDDPEGSSGGQGSTLLDPYTKEFSYPAYQTPAPFQAPDPSKVLDDPAFQFRMGEGMKAIQRSAASRGTLLTGGALKDLTQFGQDYASGEYDKIYGRAASEYDRTTGNNLTGWQNNLGLAGQTYNTNQNTFYQNQDRPFNKLFSLANLGSQNTSAANANLASFANMYGNTNSNFTNAYNNWLAGGANANAAGQVGGANAWQNAFGNIGNDWMNLAMYYANRGRTPNRPPGPWADSYQH